MLRRAQHDNGSKEKRGMSFRTSRGISLRYSEQPCRGKSTKPRVLTLGIVVFKILGDARNTFSKEQP